MILVDTNVWSEASKASGDRRVLDWLQSHRNELWLSTIVIAEIRAGVENPAAGDRRPFLETWLAALEAANARRTLSFDTQAAHTLGGLLLRKPQDAKMLDTLLAAQALSRAVPIATRNLRDFDWTGVRLINPWTQ